MVHALERPPIGLATKFVYGLGAAASGVKGRAFGTFLLILYNQVVGLPPAYVSAVIMIALVCDAFFDPSVGQASDNFRSRWGRRHPFMYASAVPYALAFFLLWNPPQGASEPVLLGYMLGMLLLIRLFDSFYELPSAALAPELAPDYHDRTVLISIRYFFGILSGAAIALLGLQVFMKENADGSGGMLAREGYFAFSLTGALIIFTVILASSLGTHRQIRYLRAVPERKMTLAVMAREIAATVNNRDYLSLLVTGMLGAIALGMAGGLTTYFALYFWEFDQGQLAILTLGGILAGVIAVSLATPFSMLLGKKRGALVCFFAAVMVNATPPTLRLLNLLPPNGDPFIFWFVFVEQILYGALGLMTVIIVSSMIADTVEASEVRTGRRSEGLLFSADNFFKKIVSGLGVFLAGSILTLVSFPATAKPGAVDPEILRMMAMIYVPAVLVLYAAAMVSLSLFRIDKAQHDENLRKLRAAQSAAE
jgi:Na+/melibiose symporter-like transporter